MRKRILWGKKNSMSEDPFNIYELLNKKQCDNKERPCAEDSLKYPPGFTPIDVTEGQFKKDEGSKKEDGECSPNIHAEEKVSGAKEKSTNSSLKEDVGESVCFGHFKKSEVPRTGGSILQLIEHLVKVGHTMRYSMEGCLTQKAKKYWVKELCVKNKVNLLSLQETKIESIELLSVKMCWGNFAFDYVHSDSVGNSGGILCVWDPRYFKKNNVMVSDYFIMIRGIWVPTGKNLLIISVYAPQELSEKKTLWDYFSLPISNWKDEVVLMGDFNEVRTSSERFGSVFNVQGAMSFNMFISKAGLEEVPPSRGVITLTLDRYLSDHRPILLREINYDYGPIPFRLFHYWFEVEGFEKLIEDTWNEAPVDDSNAMNNVMKKLKYLKEKIPVWSNDKKKSSNNSRVLLKEELSTLDVIIDKGEGNENVVNKRNNVVNVLQDMEKLKSMEAAQKAKIKWAIEEDENSKYYHGILNKKRSQLTICGILVEGSWIDSPNIVKNEFLSHFKNRFDKPQQRRTQINMTFPHMITADQKPDLECDVSREEIKRAVWDCGIDKSPGPDGFTFGFYRRFWNVIEKDVVEAVRFFFNYGSFPKGGNSSFIALIPKKPDANMVKDFRPISLIGSLYKIIAKVLANCLVVVLGDIVNEVQSAFVADRQILDGPFILNEVVQWCKAKKKQAMIFKVDFEKAYDSVRWDYLDEVLKKFGFGERWCSWIQGCLKSSRGSVIVNGSPTKEFQFYKGLKQGDPLSPFLFILVMESLHISFERVVDAGMFKGISLGSSLHLSHLFYADDAVFVGQWSNSNIDNIVHVLQCFHQASGLRINMSKSKLMGVYVNGDLVEQAALKIGCATLKMPFSYLGSNVGGLMYRIQSWNEIVDRVAARLSKWKMKTLSIGGRLTLLKSVLGSIPIYHMSIFKVPMKVLHRIESVRCHFFNGSDRLEKKPIWVKWKSVLASKEKGGLGVSSLYALNRALLFKWVWRFFTQDSSLWARVIKAIHGTDGKIGKSAKSIYPSVWLDIVHEVEKLKGHGIDLMSYIQKKLGNGANTYFWEEIWCGDVEFKKMFPRLYALEACKNLSVASKLSQSCLDFSFRRAPRGGVEQAQLADMLSKLDGVSLVNSSDRWRWSLVGSGDFSVASVRKLIDDKTLPEVSTKTRWIKVVPIKVNIHAWKVRLDGLPTRLNISRRGLDIDSILCPLCENAVESSTHIFFTCRIVREIFRKVSCWWNVSFADISSYEEWKDWIVNSRLSLKYKNLLEGVCYILWWHIWAFRNKSIFGLKNPTKAGIFDDVVSRSFYWCRSRCKASFSWIDWCKNAYLVSL
ncbi:RNA-directed DNA polymerase, eukaryota [Tanacetum coccineum]